MDLILIKTKCKMKKVLFLISIVLISLTSYGQSIKFSKYVKGDWMSYQVCMIPTQITPTMAGASVAYSIDNYHFDINVRQFLWIKRYVLTATGTSATYSISKEKYVVTDVSSIRKDGEIIGTIKIPELRMESGKCNCLLNPSSLVTYHVVTYNFGNLMIWIPEPEDPTNINYTDIYLRSIYWTRPNYVYDPSAVPGLPSGVLPVIIAKITK